MVIERAHLSASATRRAIPRASIQRFSVYYQRLDPRIPPGLRRPAGVFAPDWELVPPRVFEASEFYNDFYVRLGLRWMFGGFLEKGPEALIGLGFIRERRHGPFDHRDLRRLAPLLPHLHRATRIQRRLAGLEAVRGGATEALQRLALGVLLLDERGRPLFVNWAAEPLLAEGDGLTLRRGRLHGATGAVTAQAAC